METIDNPSSLQYCTYKLAKYPPSPGQLIGNN